MHKLPVRASSIRSWCRWQGASAVLADGKILVAGQTTTVAFGSMTLVRYDSDGSLDQTYGNNGVVITQFPNGDVGASALVLQIDGKVVLAGFYVPFGPSESARARFNSDGALDASFGRGSRVITSMGSGNAAALDL